MYIEPNSEIKILRNVPLDPTYDHSIIFTSLNNQSAYFTSCQKYNLQKQSYQRVQRGFMRINIMSENLYDCNYLMFQNTAFGLKWFYAFIKSVEYVNNNVSQIEYEIDVLQTWYFDYTLEECFVDREHTASDVLFSNLVTENLDLGDGYTCNSVDEESMNDMSVCMLISQEQNQAGYQGTTINNIYTPVRVVAGLPSTDAASIDAVINQYVGEGQEDRVIAIYQYPSWLGDASSTSAASRLKSISPNLNNIDGYVPKNKKLFAYPYNFLLVSNNNGQTAELHWENWDSTVSRGNFNVTGVFISTPCVMCYPTNYRGIPNDYDSGITISSFPNCAWVGDAFKAWWAQNRASVVTSGIATVLGTVIAAGAATVNPAVGIAAGAAVLGAEASVASTLAKAQDLQNAPPQVHGQTQTDSLNAGMGRIKFSFYSMSIKRGQAQIIDDFFTRYGYAVRRNKVPNRSVRPHWCYCKTIGCTITGSVPADDAVKICKIYDTGITWWKNGAEVGNYSYDNSV